MPGTDYCQEQSVQRQARRHRSLKFAEWKKGSYITLERNPTTSSRASRISTGWSSRRSPMRRRACWRSNRRYRLPLPRRSPSSSAVPRLKTNPKLVTVARGLQSAGFDLVLWRSIWTIRQLKDVRVRRALAYALDKQVIVEQAPTTGSAKRRPDRSRHRGGRTRRRSTKYIKPTTRAKAAAKLLDEAGYPMKADGKRLYACG